MDRVRDQLLAGARLAADQHRGVGAGDLGDLIEHLAHRPAGADQVGEVVLGLQLLAQVRVLVDEPLPLRFHQALQPDRLADHRGDDAEELGRADVEAIGLERQLDEERADRPAGDRDRHADDAQLLGLAALGGTHGQRRLLAHLRDDHAAPRIEDPLAQLLEGADAALGAAGDALGPRLLALAARQQHQAEHHRVVPLEDLERPVQARPQVQRARQRLADVDERRQFADLVPGRGGLAVGRRGGGRGGTHAGHKKVEADYRCDKIVGQQPRRRWPRCARRMAGARRTTARRGGCRER